MLHPHARALLELIERNGIPPTHTLSPEQARSFYRERRFATQPEPPAVAETRDLQAEGPHGPIPLRLLRPAGAAAGEERLEPGPEGGDEQREVGSHGVSPWSMSGRVGRPSG